MVTARSNDGPLWVGARLRRRAARAAWTAGWTLLLLAAAPASVAAAPASVSGAEISVLVRTTLVALSQANTTGNYSVLRDLGDTRFEAGLSPSALSDMFRAFRTKRVNLAPVVLVDARLDAPPRLTTDGFLRLQGHFPTRPRQVIFDITFAYQAGAWRIDALNVGLAQERLAAIPLPRPRPAGRAIGKTFREGS